MGEVPTRPKIYHITHVDNLESIVREGIFSDTAMQARGGPKTVIGIPDIKAKRLRLPVKCYDGDCVGDYVPFYFCPRSVMLYVIHQGNHPGLVYREGQDLIVHIEADLLETIEWAEKERRRWAFTTSNAGGAYAVYHRQVEHLCEVDWDAVHARTWRYVKEGKQAEFLVRDTFPWELARLIGVYSNGVLEIARKATLISYHHPPVEVLKDWYY